MPKTTEYPAKQRAINEDIANGTFKPCYLIYGDEAYLRLQNKDKLAAAMCAKDDTMNVMRVKGEDIDEEALIDFAETIPFFADRRVIIVQDSGLFKSGSATLTKFFKGELPESACFIFAESAVDKRTALYKAVSKAGLAIDCEVQNETVLRKWIGSLIIKAGKSIDDEAAKLLLMNVGTDMFNLSNEVEKLIDYTGERSEITVDDVKAVVARWLSGEIFAMTDAIVEKDHARAFRLYLDLLAMKEPPLRIGFMITRQFHIMLQVKELVERRADAAAISREISLAPFITKKYINWSKNYTAGWLKDILESCLANEKAVKTGKLDANVSVEMIIKTATS